MATRLEFGFHQHARRSRCRCHSAETRLCCVLYAERQTKLTCCNFHIPLLFGLLVVQGAIEEQDEANQDEGVGSRRGAPTHLSSFAHNPSSGACSISPGRGRSTSRRLASLRRTLGATATTSPTIVGRGAPPSALWCDCRCNTYGLRRKLLQRRNSPRAGTRSTPKRPERRAGALERRCPHGLGREFS